MFNNMPKPISGGGGLNPQDIYKSVYNVTATNVNINVTVGKTYIITFGKNNDNTSLANITGADKIFETIGNGAVWGSVGTYYRLLIVKATSSIMVVTSPSNIYDMIVVEL